MLGLIKAFIWLALTFLYAYIVGGKIPYMVFYTSLGILSTGLIWAAINAGKVRVICYAETVNAQVGSKVKMTVEFENLSGWPVPWVQCWVNMPDSFCLPDNLICYNTSLSPHEKKALSEEMECRLRGHFFWGNMLIRTGDIFGIFTNSRNSGEILELIVMPELLNLGTDLGRIIGLKQGDTPSSLRPRRTGSGFIGVRKYDVGDGMSRIHWKASARYQSLLVKEFQEQKTLEFIIFLDAHTEHHSGSGPDGTMERSVTLAASLAAAGAKCGYGTGIVVSGAENKTVPVGYGKNHFNLILETLVNVQPVTKLKREEFDYEPSLLSRKSHIFIIAGLLEEPFIDGLVRRGARGYGSTVFLFRLESFSGEAAYKAAREEGIERLAGSGIPVIMIDKETDLRLMFRGLEYEAG